MEGRAQRLPGCDCPQRSPQDLFSYGLFYGKEEKEKGVSNIQKAATLVDIDLKEVLDRVRRRYRFKLPSKVIMADYDDKEGDLYIRFSEAEDTDGEPSSDGLVVVHRTRTNAVAAIEILRLAEL